MIERLGNVLYWACMIVTGILLAVAALNATWMLADTPQASNSTPHVVMALVLAAVSWLLGRACRYVLAGR